LSEEIIQTPEQKPVVEDAKRPRRGPRGRVVIFGTWCKGCGICVAFCPAKVLALDENGHPYVAAPEKCTACHWCDTHCPDFALAVKPIEDADCGGGQ
jgi:2-oxoglutarate ferredoxin oxidoreductase subunit delta